MLKCCNIFNVTYIHVTLISYYHYKNSTMSKINKYSECIYYECHLFTTIIQNECKYKCLTIKYYLFIQINTRMYMHMFTNTIIILLLI